MEYIPLVYFSFLFLKTIRNDKQISVGSLILLFYVFVSFFGVLVVRLKIMDRIPDFSIIGTLLYCSLLTLVISPFVKFKPHLIQGIDFDDRNRKTYFTICWVFIVLNALTILLSWDKLMLSFTMEFYDIRKDYYDDSTNVGGSQALIQFVSTLTPCFSPLLILFFFFGLIKFPEKKIMNTLLIISSASYAILSVITAARTQVIYWLLMFSTLLVFFYHLLSKGVKRKVIMYGGSILAISVLYMSAVTISRFDTKTTSTMSSQESLIYYTGQQYLTFIDTYNHYSFDGITVDRTFPIISKYVLGHRNFNVANYREYQTNRLHTPTGVFFTLFGDAMLDYGIFGMCIYGFILYLLIKYNLPKNKSTISLSHLIIYVLLLRIPVLGIFAYMYASIGYSFFILGSIAIAYILKNK